MDTQIFSNVDFWAMRSSKFYELGNAAFGIMGAKFVGRGKVHASLIVRPSLASHVISKQLIGDIDPRIAGVSEISDSATNCHYAYDFLPKSRGKNGLIAIIPLDEIIGRYQDWYTWGSEIIASWILEAANDEDIAAVVIKSDCYGGDANGIELLENAVKYCKSQKPIIAHVTNAYSGAIWAITHCSEIMVESRTISGMGSIGVYSSHVDYVDYFLKEGINYEMIRAKGSENKALNNMVEKLTDEARVAIVNRVSKIRETFIKTVKSSRNGVDEKVFDGSEFNGEDAIKYGLADKIGLLGDAIAIADKLA